MFPVLIIVFFVWLNSQVLIVANDYQELCSHFKQENRMLEKNAVIQATKSTYDFNRTIYSDMNALKAAPGNEHLKDSSLDPYVKYAVSNTISDGNCSFRRVMVYVENPVFIRKEEDFLSDKNNALGLGDFSSATAWAIKDSQSSYWILDTRLSHLRSLHFAQANMNRIILKFIAYYNLYNEFPKKKPNGSNMPIGSTATLPELVSYSGTAKDAKGPYMWSQIPFASKDIFSTNGTPIRYSYRGDSYILLEAPTGILDAAGKEVIVSSFLNFQ